MSNKDADDKVIIDIQKFTFDLSGKYELQEIVDPDLLGQVGGGIDLPDLNVQAGCGDENSQADCGSDLDFLCNSETNFNCPQKNKNCDCGEDGDGE